MVSKLGRPKTAEFGALPRAAEQLLLSIWLSPAACGVITTVVYATIAAAFSPRSLGQSGAPYFVYLADAFLHGRFDLHPQPGSTLDLSLYRGHYYMYWPPLPTVLFMPFVAVFGTTVSDAPLALAAAGLNVALVSKLLAVLDKQNVVTLSPVKRAWLTAFFAFGTVHASLASYPSVWFISQLIGFSFLCGAYIAAISLPINWAALLSGLLIACTLLTRNSMVFAGGWAGWYLLMRARELGHLALLKVLVIVLVPIVLAAGLQGEYNYLRFGSPFESGLSYHIANPMFRADFQHYGAFSLHYLPEDFYYSFVYVPYLALLAAKPGLLFFFGGNLFLMSPVFFFAVVGALRQWRTHGWVLLASCVFGYLPSLLVIGHGGLQFGPRYTLDIMVPLLVATAMGATGASRRQVSWLTLASVAVYLPGAIFLRVTGVIA